MTLDPLTLFTALADETRLRCLALLASGDELCVCELTCALGESQPKVSRHLATLRELGIVADRRAGLWVHYRLHPELPAWTRRVLRETLTGIANTKPYARDREALKRMPNRPAANRCSA
jgi:ArsR family transcriptional regulator, arsenate/arsenite/antimonite-responsive transcriptional repressor